MRNNLVWFSSRLSLIIFSYLIITYGFVGFTSTYREGDSLNYHIPIAKSYLNLTVYNPELIQGVPFLVYQPGNNQGIIAFLMLVGIPINLFNVFGLIALLLVGYFTARKFDLGKDLSLLFAGSITTLHTMTRWINTQIIDIWMLVWFLLTLGLLQKPEKNPTYFLFLGIASGMFLGSKYSAPLFLLILIIFYINKIWKYLNFKNVTAFLIPFSFLGISWYLRNYYFAGNPLWPEPFLLFSSNDSFGILGTRVWETTFLRGALGIDYFVDALIAEFTLWSIVIFSPILLVFRKVREQKIVRNLILIGSLGLIVFSMLPSDEFYNIVVSVFRYSYPAFITLILAVFVISQKFKFEKYLAVFAITNFIFITQLQYRPKIVLLMLPIVLVIFFWEDIRKYLKI